MQELSPVFEGDVEHDDGSDNTAKVQVGDCLTNWKLRGKILLEGREKRQTYWLRGRRRVFLQSCERRGDTQRKGQHARWGQRRPGDQRLRPRRRRSRGSCRSSSGSRTASRTLPPSSWLVITVAGFYSEDFQLELHCRQVLTRILPVQLRRSSQKLCV